MDKISFHKWAISEGFPVAKDAKGDYVMPTKSAYQAWQAALEKARLLCLNLRHHEFSAESDDWKQGTFDCAHAIGKVQVSTRFEKVSL